MYIAMLLKTIRQCLFMIRNRLMGTIVFPSGTEGSNIVEQLNEEENGTEIKLLEWNATAAVNLLPLFNPKNPDMVLKSQVTISQYQVDKFNGWFTPVYLWF